MQKTIYTAVVLLALQLGLVIAFNSRTTGLEVNVSGSFFENFKQDKISSIEIIDGANNRLTLKKTDTGWLMPDDYSVPADTAVITGVLDKLASAQKGLAIATSPAAAKRFETAKDTFERHVIMKEGDTTVADFYLGTSAGLRHSHARKSGENAIFSIPISSYELSAERNEWLDKDLARIDPSQIQKIRLNNLVLEKEQDNWKITAPEPAATNSKAVQDFLDNATGLTIRDVYDPDEVSSLFTNEVAEKLTFIMDDTSQLTYTFAKKDDDYILRMSNNDLYFKVMSWQLDNLLAVTADKLNQSVTEGSADSTQSAQREKQDH